MTDHAVTDPEPVGASLALVEAFLDGEPVDPQALRTALERADVRDHFVDLLVLREGVRAMAPGGWSAVGGGGRPGRRVRWIAAAAAVVLSLATGYYTGQRAVSTVEARSVETVVGIDGPPAAPPPTQVIKLEPGVNWTDGRGGQ